MDLLKKKIFFKLRNAKGPAPADPTEFKSWRNDQKMPIGKWSDKNNRFTYSQLQDHANVGMAIPQGYILIDIDDQLQGARVHKLILEKGLKCIISNTGKGKHFLFKDPKGSNRAKQSNGEMCMIGINIDSRIPAYGEKNGGYVVVKFFPDINITGNPYGERFTQMMDLEEVDDLPFWLEPISQQHSEAAKTVVATKWLEGNRDESLRSWTTILWKSDTSKRKELDETLSIINDYIMDKPLLNARNFKLKVEGWVKWAEENKIDRTFTIGDEDQSYAAFGLVDGKQSIDYINLTKHMTELYKIAYYEGNWWMKKDHNWYDKITDEDILFKFIEEAGNVALKADEKRLFNALKVSAVRKKTDDKSKLINFKNGRYDIKDKELKPYSGSEFLTFGIEVEYKDNPKWPQVDSALNDWTQGHQEEVDTLMEFVGSVMYSKNSGYEKGLILYGPAAKNGKSTFLEMMTNLFNRAYISAMNFKSLESQFGAYSLIGKKLISIPELEDTYIESSPKFKSIITGDPINIEGKNIRNEITWYPTVRFIGATNRFPRFNDQTNGIWRRIIILPFEFVPTKEQEKAFKKKDIMCEEARERLAYLAIQGLIRYLGNKKFSEPVRSIESKEKMQILSNPVHAWSLDYEATQYECIAISEELSYNFSQYKQWCIANSYKALGKNKFKEELTRVRKDLYWDQNGNSAAILRRKITKKAKKEMEDLFGKKNLTNMDDILKG